MEDSLHPKVITAMDTNLKMGKLRHVPLREAWASEPYDFTPWLAKQDNLKLLGEAVGMELEHLAQEQPVGPFRADIVCRNATDGSCVLIENQLQRTDHTHMGQLLTYAAGLDAVAMIWVAETFTDEHRAALDWFNTKMPPDIGFFGLEIELWRIDDSPIAPKFNVVSMPNEWTKTAASRSAGSDLALLCQDYWQGVISILEPSGILTMPAKPSRKQDISFPVGWHDFHLKAYFSRAKNNAAAWVACRGENGWNNFLTIKQSADQIEHDCGGRIAWWETPDQNRGSFALTFSDFDPTNRDDWARQHRFLADALKTLHRVATPFVQSLQSSEP